MQSQCYFCDEQANKAIILKTKEFAKIAIRKNV